MLMRYSLRTLLIFIAITAVIIAVRIEYLRRRAAFHEQQAQKYAAEIEAKRGKNQLAFMLQFHNTKDNGKPMMGCFVDKYHQGYVQHKDTAYDFRQAMTRPWIRVHEPAFPDHVLETARIRAGSD